LRLFRKLYPNFQQGAREGLCRKQLETMLALLLQNKILISLETDNAPNTLADGAIFNQMMIEEF
jgi:hypothetical protein